MTKIAETEDGYPGHETGHINGSHQQNFKTVQVVSRTTPAKSRQSP